MSEWIIQAGNLGSAGTPETLDQVLGGLSEEGKVRIAVSKKDNSGLRFYTLEGIGQALSGQVLSLAYFPNGSLPDSAHSPTVRMVAPGDSGKLLELIIEKTGIVLSPKQPNAAQPSAGCAGKYL